MHGEEEEDEEEEGGRSVRDSAMVCTISFEASAWSRANAMPLRMSSRAVEAERSSTYHPRR
jgi:hypothetical protein